MRLRLITSFTAFERTVKIYWNSEVQEYVCKLYIDGKHYEPADYFTEDKADAENTACHMCNQDTREIRLYLTRQTKGE